MNPESFLSDFRGSLRFDSTLFVFSGAKETLFKLHHHMFADGEFHDCHCIDGAERDIHRVVMGVVAY